MEVEEGIGEVLLVNQVKVKVLEEVLLHRCWSMFQQGETILVLCCHFSSLLNLMVMEEAY